MTVSFNNGTWTHDRFNFSLNPMTGFPIFMADPTIVWLPGPVETGGGWYYITGTDDQRCTANFMIYRTRDFVHFFEHKLAFDDSERQGRIIHIVDSHDDRVYAGLHSPQLFIDPHDPDTVHLLFTATIGYLVDSKEGSPFDYFNVRTIPYRNSMNTIEQVNPLYPWDSTCGLNTFCQTSNPEDIWTDCNAFAICDRFFDVLQQVSRYQSNYVTSMPIGEFISAASTENFTTSGTGLRWFGYCEGNSCIPGAGSCNEQLPTDGYLYDGGQSLSPPRFVPASASPYLSDASYCADRPLMHCECFENLDLGACYSLTCCPPFGLAHRRIASGPEFESCGAIADLIWSDATFMTDGGFMFYDALDLDTSENPRGWMLYGWTSAGCTPPMTDRNLWRGNHVAGARILRGGLENDWQFDVSGSFSALPFANRKNVPGSIVDNCGNLQPNGCIAPTLNLEGTEFLALGHPCGWCIAESPSAFFHSGSNSYYLLYSRNVWSGGAYSVLYRAGLASTGTFSSMALPNFTDPDVTEHLLVSARRFLPGGGIEDRRTVALGRNYGSAELFYLRDPSGCFLTDETGQRLPYAIFHVKMDQSNYRTVFFKRVYFQPLPNQHLLVEMLEDHSNDPRRDPWGLQLPGRPCMADWNQNDAVDSQDFFDFVACFFTPAVCPGRDRDINGSGSVDSQDWFDWLTLYFAGCP